MGTDYSIPDNTAIAIARSDDATFGIFHSRFHELWSPAWAHGGMGRTTLHADDVFETFPFPAGLTPQDTSSQQTRRLASGAVVPDVKFKNQQNPSAEAAYKLTTLRDNWLNPPDWTSGCPKSCRWAWTASPYPERIVPKPGHEKELSGGAHPHQTLHAPPSLRLAARRHATPAQTSPPLTAWSDCTRLRWRMR